MFMCPYPSQYGEPTGFLLIQFMQNIPFFWGERGLAPYPFLANNSFS
jgi:hypothetical protein